jgi:hypothetical protein
MAVVTLVEFCLISAPDSQLLFVEGNNSTSWDAKIYDCIFPTSTVIPVGSAGLVIKYVEQARRTRPDMQNRIHGLIDKDRRSSEDEEALKKKGIFVLQVAEVENLFCTTEVIELLCFERGVASVETIKSIKGEAFALLRKKATEQISLRAREKLKTALGKYQNVYGKTALGEELKRIISSISLDPLYATHEKEFEAVFSSKNYNALLAYFNDKSLKDVVARHFSLRGPAYIQTIIELAGVSTEKQQELCKALKNYLGGL